MSNTDARALIESIVVECEKLEDEALDDYLINAFANIGATAQAALAAVIRKYNIDEEDTVV